MVGNDGHVIRSEREIVNYIYYSPKLVTRDELSNIIEDAELLDKAVFNLLDRNLLIERTIDGPERKKAFMIPPQERKRARNFSAQLIYLDDKSLMEHIPPSSIKLSDVSIEITKSGNGVITLTKKGVVNWGSINSREFTFYSDKACTLKENKITVKNIGKKGGGIEISPVPPSTWKDKSQFKRVELRFGEALQEGDEFAYELKYVLPHSFKLNGEDYYRMTSYHKEDQANLEIIFPENIEIITIEKSVMSKAGKDIPAAYQIRITPDRKKIIWPIGNVILNTVYKLIWETKKSVLR